MAALRRFAVPATITLPKLHAVLQVVMGWFNCHQFSFDDECYGPTDPDWPSDMKEERGKKLEPLLNRAQGRFLYEYDFGDGWTHEVEVCEDVDPGELARAPVCIDGARACPPEDCGGPFGYADFLAAIPRPES